MARLAEYILTQSLPYYLRTYGFRVYQEDQDTLVLEHDNETVNKFRSDIEHHILVEACREHMVKCHGYQEGSI